MEKPCDINLPRIRMNIKNMALSPAPLLTHLVLFFQWSSFLPEKNNKVSCLNAFICLVCPEISWKGYCIHNKIPIPETSTKWYSTWMAKQNHRKKLDIYRIYLFKWHHHSRAVIPIFSFEEWTFQKRCQSKIPSDSLSSGSMGNHFLATSVSNLDFLLEELVWYYFQLTWLIPSRI